MRKKIFAYFELAAKLAHGKDNTRSFLLSAIGERSDGALVQSINSPSVSPNRLAHAEYKLSRKIDVGSTIYVARVRLADGKLAMARPCHSCMKVLKFKGVSRVYYTTSPTGWGFIDFDKNTEASFSSFDI